jgi:hypothetical protein
MIERLGCFLLKQIIVGVIYNGKITAAIKMISVAPSLIGM